MATPTVSRYQNTSIKFYDTISDAASLLAANELLSLVPSIGTVDAAATSVLTFGSDSTSTTTTQVVLRNIHNPELDQDAATKAYVDGIAVSGVTWKNTVKAASTANIGTFPPTDGVTTVTALDGVTLLVGDRVLIKDQTTQTENGIYEVTAGTWVRASDAPTGASASGFAVWVDQGTASGDKGYVVTTDSGSDVVGTNNIVWATFSSAPSASGVAGDVQFYNNGSLDAATTGVFRWDDANSNLIVTGDDTGPTISVSGGSLAMDTGDAITLGASGTFSLSSDNTDGTISNTSGNLFIDNSSAGGSTIMKMGDAAGATSVIFYDSASTDLWHITSDGDVNHNVGSYTLKDTIPLNVGTGNDLVISHDGTNSSVVNTTGELQVTQNASGSDLVIQNSSATAGDDIILKLGVADNTSGVNFVNSADASLMKISGAQSENSTSLTTGTVQITGGLAVSQDISTTGVNYLSDATTKTNIMPLSQSDPLGKIKQIEGYNYNFLPGYSTNDRMNTGVLAQQLETIEGMEHCVTTDPASGYKSVNYIFLIPMMIEAIKKLSEKQES